MKYMGSKRRIAKYILPIMLAEKKPEQWWVEPFVGGGNVIDKVAGNRIGADLDHYAIDALISIRDCVLDLPKNNSEFTEDDYKKLKENDDYKYKGYAGFSFGFGSRWLATWRKDKDMRDYVKQSYNSAIKQSPLLQGVILVNQGYLDLKIPDNSVIYCDPPYYSTYGYTNKIDHVVFWEWVRTKSKEGHKVFVSEYNAPNDFECIWQKEIANFIKTSNNAIEKLFRIKT